MKIHIRSLSLVGGLCLAGVPVAQAADMPVTVSSNVFTPAVVTINVGDSVTWTNTGGFHNVVSDDGLFTSGPPAVAPWTYSHTFPTLGTFRYYCQVHGAAGGVGMSGTVVVQPPPSISIADRAIAEGNTGTTVAVFTLTLSASSTSTVSVTYQTADGTATAGSDYTAAGPATVTFPPGTTAQTVPVTVIGDTLSEDNETFFVNLSAPSNATIARAQAVGTILDDDDADLFTIAPCRVVNTRLAPGPTGGPALAANTTRVFPISGACGIPADARAVALIVTVVNAGDLGDLRLYPADSAVPGASTINFAAGRTRANNALIVLGTGGAIAVRNDMPAGSSATADVLIDVSGYFKRR